MASSSVGSNVFAGLALLTISVLVLLLLRYYLPLRSTPGYLLVPVFLALALPLSIILLVPIDLASSSGTDTEGGRGIWLPQRVNLVAWRITYWLTFLLTWAVLPLLGEYSDSGYREPRDRLIYSLRSNGRYQLIVLGVAILGAVYFFLTNGFSGQSLKALVIALAYAWGLVMAIYLMGHGLVAIPRRLFRNASTENRLKRLQSHAPKIHDKLEEAQEDLAVLEAQAAQLQGKRAGARGDLKDWIDEVVETTAGARPPAYMRSGTAGIPAVITERYMAELSRKLKRARHKHARFADEWQRLVDKSVDLQAIIDAAGSKRLFFTRGSSKPKLTLLTPYTRYLLYAHGLPAIRLGSAGILGLASVALIWSEVIHTVSSKLSIVGLTVVHHPDSSRGQVGLGGQVIAAAWLFYMCFAALYSMSEVKVWGNRALVKRQTYGESACWYSLQVAKLTVPLSYNFITMLQPTIFKETAFFKFLGVLIKLTPLGEGFSQYFPAFVLIPVVATLFNLHGKVKNIFGFGVLDDESEENTPGAGSGWREGRALIEREIQDRSSNLGVAPRDGSFRDRSSLDESGNNNEGRAPLLLPIGGASRSSNSGPAARQPPEEEDDSPRYFFQDFGERVKNTFDTSERPQWLQEIGDAFSKPKWMDSESSGNGENFFSRMFGGESSSDGRVRL
ncbi:LMBR1-like membrane protein-domain-containing protein [Elsinoe ampelina]|uniref:LMBR1-like membrane protein-domain-containing protein n=1 Tax=Elsinoe ampelina TaxID=302913 RepID=A0A6A6GKY0_9PEZI|nr:LMBR1-like membrane protein-domain-containing protein [Elsinoe ampelina]